MKLFSLVPVVLGFLLVAIDANYIYLHNQCSFTIWPGILNNYFSALPEHGGFALNSSGVHRLGVHSHWAGQIWARTGCDAKGHCATGDCGGKIECSGKGPTGPITIAHFAFDSIADKDYYEVSLEHGYNLPIRVSPSDNYNRSSHDYYDCTPAGCKTDLNEHCPTELVVHDAANHVIGCKSPCQAHNTDQYCCRGAFDQPDKCKSADWPSTYGVIKNACPDAKNNRFDSNTRPFWCTRERNATDFNIFFCPK